MKGKKNNTAYISTTRQREREKQCFPHELLCLYRCIVYRSGFVFSIFLKRESIGYYVRRAELYCNIRPTIIDDAVELESLRDPPK